MQFVTEPVTPEQMHEYCDMLEQWNHWDGDPARLVVQEARGELAKWQQFTYEIIGRGTRVSGFAINLPHLAVRVGQSIRQHYTITNLDELTNYIKANYTA